MEKVDSLSAMVKKSEDAIVVLSNNYKKAVGKIEELEKQAKKERNYRNYLLKETKTHEECLIIFDKAIQRTRYACMCTFVKLKDMIYEVESDEEESITGPFAEEQAAGTPLYFSQKTPRLEEL